MHTVAGMLRERKFEFAAWMVFEVGKNWAEADADIAETIDFAEFYAREALRLAQAKTPVQLPGEGDRLMYIPLGVAAVIPPWNFPCAIMAGMTMAAIVTGNTVVLKPSHDSPAIAAKFFEVLQEAGMPDGVVNFCPGSGSTFGAGLVEHPLTRFMAFTGSKEVGLDINQRAAKPQPGQKWIKRTILEMGGKDSIIVDADANLDAAVEGVAQAAFGFQGQKCSACSRAIVDEKIYDVFLERLKDRVSKIAVGDPTENKAMGPGGERQGDEEHPGLHRDRQERRPADSWRRPGDGSGRRLLHPADGDCRYRTHGAHCPGRNFWAGAGGDQVAQFR